MELIGRKREKRKLDKLCKSSKSEFLAVYGRRRVGKTFLIKQYFENRFCFYTTGLAKGNTQQQLSNFTISLQSYFSNDNVAPKNWLEAFNLLKKAIEKKATKEKQVIFIDEMPWLDTKKSDFMMGLESFWNSYASAKDNILLIVCGSAASWMLNNLIKNTGGLYNRVTDRLKLEPFNLGETEEYFRKKQIALDRYQIIQLYMVMGGVPYYFEQLESGKSAMQSIEDLCFRNDGKLRTEFDYIFSALFRKADRHELVLRTIFERGGALTREELLKFGNFNSGGNISKLLSELEESGFITSFRKMGTKKRTPSIVFLIFTPFFTYAFWQTLVVMSRICG